MEKDFWIAIREDKYALPQGCDLSALTEELFGYLGSTDPELRDKIGYETFANWLELGLYTPDQMRAYALRLQLHLQDGLGEPESDSLFLRAFAVLFLAEIIYHENRDPFMDGDEVRNILAKGLAYMEAEADPRGYVQGKGWGHALAHTADLLLELARSRHLHAPDLARILNAISAKLVSSNYWIYVNGEDDRLARAVMAAFERDLLDEPTLDAWLASLLNPQQSWKGSWQEESRTAAYFNTRNFVRSLALYVANSRDLPHREKLQGLLLETVFKLRQF
jgi:hypothetical protein